MLDRIVVGHFLRFIVDDRDKHGFNHGTSCQVLGLEKQIMRYHIFEIMKAL